MTHTKRLLISLLAIAACGNALQAQNATPRHEVSASLQGLGLGSTPFRNSLSWNDQPGLALGFNLGYTYWFNTNFGIRSGVRVNILSHNQVINNLDMTFTSSLPLSSIGFPGGNQMTPITLRTTAASVQEEQQYTFVEVPILLAMRYQQVYANFGLSLAKAVNATADYSYTDPSCAITYVKYTNTHPNVPLNSRGALEGSVKNRNMEKPFFVPLAAEVGYNIPIGDVTNISVGLFGRFAPFAYKTDNAVDAYGIQPDATYRVVQPSNSTMAEKRGYYEVGVSLGVNFGITKRVRSYEECPRTQDDASSNLSAAELDAMKSARETAEKELAAMKDAREKTEKELAATKAAREKAESELAAMKAAQKEAEKMKAAAEKNESNVATREKAATQKQANTNTKLDDLKTRVEAVEVNFNFQSTTPRMSDADRMTLSELATAMKEDNDIKVVVTGYTDNSGSNKTNNKYGIQRARAVKNHLVKQGAPSANIECVSKGENDPQYPNDTRDNRSKNRRATVKIK